MQRKYIEDLKEFLELTKAKRGLDADKNYPNEYWHLNFYFSHTEEELKEYITKLDLLNKEVDDFTFNYYVNMIIKYMNGEVDSHSMLMLAKRTELPYQLKWLNNEGLFIEQVNEDKFRKAKILRVNGVDINELVKSYEMSVSYACLSRFYSLVEQNFRILEVLYSLPNFNRLNDKIVLETDRGILNIDINNMAKLPSREIPNYYIKDKAMVFRYRSCHPYYISVIDSLIKTMDEELKKGNINKFVLDLRDNGGGNSGIIKPLIDYLERQKIECTTIVNKGVFSSGRFAAIDMKNIQSKIIGEEIGTPINCFGNILKPKCLKNTKQQPIFTKTYWYLDDKNNKMTGIYERKELEKFPKDFFKPQFLKLDMILEESYEDYQNCYDVFMDRALNSIELKK